MMEIQEFLYATELYGSLADLNKDLKGWVKDYETKKIEVEKKNNS